MERLLRCGFVLIVMCLLLLPCGIKADIAPQQAKGGAASTKTPHQTIRMEAEEVTIRLHGHSYTVDAVFHMANSGQTATEWVGFPIGAKDFTYFHTWVEGKPVQFAKEADGWMAGQVLFPGKTTSTIRVQYEANYYRGQFASYVIGTGSFWKDTIAKASFVVEGSGVGGSKNFSVKLDAPNSRRLLTDSSIRIDVKDYKPHPDATLGFWLN